MNALTRIAVGALGGIRWLLLAVAAGAVALAELAKDGAERLRNRARFSRTAAEQQPENGTFAEFKAQHLPAMREAAMSGRKVLDGAFADLPEGPHKEAFRSAFWWSLSAEAAAADAEVAASAKGQNADVAQDGAERLRR